MKKTLVLVIALVLAMGMVASADTYTKDVYAGWNFISVPLVPFDSTVENVFTGFDFAFDASLQTLKNGVPIEYDYWNAGTDLNPLPNILIGQGYYFNTAVDGSISYEGVADGVPAADGTMTDMWLSFPTKGWQMFGHPFNHETFVNSDQSDMGSGDNIFFTDGASLKNWEEAAIAGWVASSAFSEASSIGYFFADKCSFEPGYGYYIETNVDNLAMIIPAY